MSSYGGQAWEEGHQGVGKLGALGTHQPDLLIPWPIKGCVALGTMLNPSEPQAAQRLNDTMWQNML